jgi:transmembrane sensor
MSIEKEQWSRLASYLSGQLSEAEKAAVEKWIETSEENSATFQEAKRIWEHANVRLVYPEIDSQQLLAAVKSESSNELMGAKLISLVNQPVWKIAASLTMIVILSYFVIKWATKDEITIKSGDNIAIKSEADITIKSGAQVATLYLPDSSKVWLNINSEITYSKNFSPRKIALSGEAFLSVRKDSSDFIVTNQHTITKVTGTAFNLKEESDTSVVLTVAEGVVEFSKRDSETKETAVVKAREKAVFKKNAALVKEKNNDLSFAKWREENNPVFQDEKNNPTGFLSTKYSWRKNQINQSVIEGSLYNNASLVAYKEIVLEVTYTKPNGTKRNVELTIDGIVYPGKELAYKKRLLDLLSDTKSVVVKIKSANVKTTNTF